MGHNKKAFFPNFCFIKTPKIKLRIDGSAPLWSQNSESPAIGNERKQRQCQKHNRRLWKIPKVEFLTKGAKINHSYLKIEITTTRKLVRPNNYKLTEMK